MEEQKETEATAPVELKQEQQQHHQQQQQPEREIETQASTNDAEKQEPPAKKMKLDDRDAKGNGYVHGVAPIKKEYLLPAGSTQSALRRAPDDDAAEGHTTTQEQQQDGRSRDDRDRDGNDGKKRKWSKDEKKARQGQNKGRKFFAKDMRETPLCRRAIHLPEFQIKTCCNFDRCKEIHDLREYLATRKNLQEATVKCPIFELKGWCPSGWKCTWVKSHMEEVEVPGEGGGGDDKKEVELRLVNNAGDKMAIDGAEADIRNTINYDQKHSLFKRKYDHKKSDFALQHLSSQDNRDDDKDDDSGGENAEETAKKDNAAVYKETVLKPSEKRKIHISASTPLLAPLTTTGNLPFRRLCHSLGASITYSEMAMSVPLLKGEKVEWARIRSHASESHFGAQIEASKPWQAIKATEVLADFCPSLHLIDLNCGCPLDPVWRAGGGSGLLDSAAKLLKMVKGMNYVSGDIPITVKLRNGSKDGKPVAHKLVKRIINETQVAAITLHGRSRQQRYTKSADWSYIARCSSVIKDLKKQLQEDQDTSSDDKEQSEAQRQEPYFIGNGDCYSHADYYRDLEETGADSVMIARGALIKPWLFEEIHARQYLDKSATERLAYIEQFAKYGLDYWGSDEVGVNTTRRFLCEWLSFTHRYVPVGILEYLPPRLQDRPPLWHGRNELETLLGSDDARDWVKISEMFLGKTAESFNFVPKHKSNSYDAIEAEG